MRTAVIRSLVILAGSAFTLIAQPFTEIQAVNVTPSSFSVVWKSAELGDPAISVYSDAAGQQSLDGQVGVELFPVRTGSVSARSKFQTRQSVVQLQRRTRSMGLMHVRVSDASPNTTYYYRLHVTRADGERISFPATGALPAIRTANASRFVPSVQQLFFTVPGESVEGQIVTMSLEGSAASIAGVVADGAKPNQVYFNLSDLFLADGLNFIPVGTHTLNLKVLGAGETLTAQMKDTFSAAFAVAESDFQYFGGERVSVILGDAIVETGSSGTLGIRADVMSDSAALAMDIEVEDGTLLDLAVAPISAIVGTASIRSLSPSRYRIEIGARAGSTLHGDQLLAQLQFGTAVEARSAFVPVKLLNISAVKPDGSTVVNLFGQSGRVTVVGAEPLLEAFLTQDLQRTLKMYALPGSYVLQESRAVGQVMSWRDVMSVDATGLTTDLGEMAPVTGSVVYRVANASVVVNSSAPLRLYPALPVE